MEEVGKKGVPFVTVFASGFAEVGNETLEKEVLQIAEKYNIRIIGPNCLGPFNAADGMAFSFGAKKNTPGHVSFMSQSGGHMSQLLDAGYKRDIRFRYGVSFGNQIDLNCLDFLNHFYYFETILVPEPTLLTNTSPDEPTAENRPDRLNNRIYSG